MKDAFESQLLATLVAIAETGSFSAAADRVGRTLSAVSMQVRKLEEMVGQPPLFQKTGRRMILTERGEILLSYARRILTLQEEAAMQMRIKSCTAKIKLGAPEDYVGDRLGSALESFSNRFPHTQVDVVCEPSGTLSRLARDRKIDIGIVTTTGSDHGVEVLRKEPMRWICATKHALHEQPTVPLALFQPGCIGRAMALDAWGHTGRPYRIAYSSPSISSLIAVVRAGLAISPLPLCSIPKDIRVLDDDAGVPILPSLPIGLVFGSGGDRDLAVESLATELRASYQQN
ncbi:LysR substrate-binding domain-containing protein [Nguyenibacter sp. L1]|uniref:LysR substrate-binding domain-containing protein n=1 Tax=Nguyenibacter sp. L1 TaxID=3049350 RepID=UPI002B4A5A5B|nr:LysR substrate-binding domain-containing protein [Nguyenibacter sp. L1]WRH89288.1 LysR substrate-binding domain-containing protein [Nguyenibacter sp. L1]